MLWHRSQALLIVTMYICLLCFELGTYVDAATATLDSRLVLKFVVEYADV